MTTIIEDLLLLARAESKSVAMNWAVHKSSDFANELAEKVKAIYESRGVGLTIETSNAPDVFNCSQGYLSLALKNILLNAAKHSGKGSTVTFSVFEQGADIIFEISDKGEGIPEESLPNIFDPFYRADTARNRASGGVGIGLSLALALVRLHQGDIEVTSTVGVGTTFTAKIPLKHQGSEAGVS